MKKRVRVILSAGLGAALLAGCAGPNLVGVGDRCQRPRRAGRLEEERRSLPLIAAGAGSDSRTRPQAAEERPGERPCDVMLFIS